MKDDIENQCPTLGPQTSSEVCFTPPIPLFSQGMGEFTVPSCSS